MVDDNNTNPPADAVTAVAPTIPAMKKQRGPRRQKTVTEAVAAPSAVVVKSTRAYHRKVSDVAVDAKPSSVTIPATAKKTKKDSDKGASGTKSLASPKQTATGLSSAIDEMADLLQLEEENKRLRKALSDKLRSENADLRKRLGVM